MQIKDLFEIKKPKTLTFVSMIEDPQGINFVSSRATNNGCNGKVKKQEGITIYPAGSISVPLKGSVLQASLQTEDFYCAHQTAVLIPKVNLSIREKIYYVLVIRSHAEKYNYGRQADRTIENLEIPSPNEIPSWVYEMEIPTFGDISEAKTTEKVELPPVSEWKSFRYDELFNLVKGRGPSATEAKHNPGNIPYVGASAENNGITLYSSHAPAHEGKVITIATDGSVGEAFYQSKPFNATSNIMVVTIKDQELTPALAMFLTTLIRQEKIKFNYGRKWGLNRMKGSMISLPVDSFGNPDWQLMENYINSLPYSKYL